MPVLYNMVKIYPFILQILLLLECTLMRLEDHLGNKRTLYLSQILLFSFKIKKNIKNHTLKIHGIQVTLVVSFLKETWIYSLQAANDIRMPKYHCTLPKIQIFSILLYYDILDSR